MVSQDCRVVKEWGWVPRRARGPALGVRQFRQFGASGRYEVAGDLGRSNLVRGGRFLESQDFGWLGFGVRWEEERLRQICVQCRPILMSLANSGGRKSTDGVKAVLKPSGR